MGLMDWIYFIDTDVFIVSIVSIGVLVSISLWLRLRRNWDRAASTVSHDTITPESVNYHFTRQCNYQCGFCFHTAKTSFVLPIGEAKRGLLLLKNAGQSANISALNDPSTIVIILYRPKSLTIYLASLKCI